MATGGCWIVIDGKKVAAMRGKDGIAKPVTKPTKTTAKAKE